LYALKLIQFCFDSSMFCLYCSVHPPFYLCTSIVQKSYVWITILCAGKIRLVKSGDSAANISLDELSKFAEYLEILISYESTHT
jgi:hypothetical protein